jgi:hypothetical protein
MLEDWNVALKCRIEMSYWERSWVEVSFFEMAPDSKWHSYRPGRPDALRFKKLEFFANNCTKNLPKRRKFARSGHPLPNSGDTFLDVKRIAQTFAQMLKNHPIWSPWSRRRQWWHFWRHPVDDTSPPPWLTMRSSRSQAVWPHHSSKNRPRAVENRPNCRLTRYSSNLTANFICEKMPHLQGCTDVIKISRNCEKPPNQVTLATTLPRKPTFRFRFGAKLITAFVSSIFRKFAA